MKIIKQEFYNKCAGEEWNKDNEYMKPFIELLLNHHRIRFVILRTIFENTELNQLLTYRMNPNGFIEINVVNILDLQRFRKNIKESLIYKWCLEQIVKGNK